MFLFRGNGHGFKCSFFCLHPNTFTIRLIQHTLPFIDVRNDFDSGTGEHIVQLVTHGALSLCGL